MYFRKPVVLLLGGLVTASAFGCSAASVLVSDQRPKQAVRQSSSDRMVAIGRMFEEQGKLDRAEAMYRGALKKNGRSAEARQLLSDVQVRRRSPQPAAVAATGRPFRPMGAPAETPAVAYRTPSAVVKPSATAATAAARPAAPPASATTPSAATPAPTPASNPTAAAAAQQPIKPVSRLKTVAGDSQPVQPPTSPAVTQPAAPAATTPTKNPTSGSTATPSPAPSPTPAQAQATAPSPTPAPAAAPAGTSPTAPPAEATPVLPSAPEATFPEPAAAAPGVKLEDVLTAAESPSENTSLLIEALRSGDAAETRCLAAALLGECDGNDPLVTGALEESGGSTDDVCLLLAVVDSQLQHSTVNSSTAANLVKLLPGCEPAVQVQGLTTLRHFSGMSCREECVQLLTGLLESAHADVRVAAALTLSDFRPLPAEAVSRLEKLSAEDASEEVRESAAASLARGVK